MEQWSPMWALEWTSSTGRHLDLPPSLGPAPQTDRALVSSGIVMTTASPGWHTDQTRCGGRGEEACSSHLQN